MENQSKRDRSSNWSEEEKLLLITLIEPHKKYLENKTKFFSTNKQKEDCWKEIYKNFASEGYNRPIPRLKEQWRRMKMQAKKNISVDMKSMKATGSGPPPSPEATQIDEMVLSVAPHISIHDVAEFDNDQTTFGSEVSLSSDTEVLIMEIEAPEPIDQHSNSPHEPFNMSIDTSEGKENTLMKEPDIHETSNIEDKGNSFITQAASDIPQKRKVLKKRKDMSAYEAEMCRMNEAKINLAMKHMDEAHKLSIAQSKELHEKRMQYEKLLFELKKYKVENQ